MQCDPGDVEQGRSLLRGPVEAHLVEDLTHVLRLDSGPPTLLGAHKLLQNGIAAIVPDLASEWLRRVAATSREAKASRDGKG